MSWIKKEEKGAQDAADKIKAAALAATKGLSRAQAEQAAAAAVRNVNAYGQKEEGPSRWQERKEAKRQMYLGSTEKQVILGERKDCKSSMFGIASKCHLSSIWAWDLQLRERTRLHFTTLSYPTTQKSKIKDEVVGFL